tara:strand:- start:189 stop:869 length:681 start_codon:yes stop_codon:yes gene_type:complete
MLLMMLPSELSMHVMEMLASSPMDCAALTLATPLHFTQEARRRLAHFKGLLYQMAMALLAKWRILDVALLRQYGTHTDATVNGCRQITDWATLGNYGTCKFRVTEKRNGVQLWYLCQQGAPPIRVRTRVWWFPKPECVYDVLHARADVARIDWKHGCLLKIYKQDGTKETYDGDKGCERLCEKWHPDGTFEVFEGAKGKERIVYRKRGDGTEELLDASGAVTYVAS